MRIEVAGPGFEDLKVGQILDDAPAITITAGMAALYASLTGDRMRLPLDAALTKAVTGSDDPLAHPGLVWNIAIGASTGLTQRVRANLFYRNMVSLRPVFVGETLRTRTEVVALKENARRPGKPATGLAVLRMRCENQRGEPVLDFWRCPMLPFRDTEARTGYADSFDDIPAEIASEAIHAAIPQWDLDAFRAAVPAERAGDLVAGTTYAVAAREPVTGAPGLVRLTLNAAVAHLDPDASAYGRRLVYGGHTISIACSQIVRAVPGIVTVLAWRSCDHTGPVFEDDLLRTDVTVESVEPLPAGGGLADLRAITYATRDDEAPVLDWRLVALVA
ncbi:MAG TPA: MaoC family dehydratase [Actinomycetota bacterium]|nr:MaoC family dehydratase [Actinomycetota bacterium]